MCRLQLMVSTASTAGGYPLASTGCVIMLTVKVCGWYAVGVVEDGEPNTGPVGAAVRARVGRWLVEAGRRAWTPRGLLVMLASCVLAPLLTSGADLQQVELLATATAAGVGGNTLSDLLAEVAEHVGRHTAPGGGEVPDAWVEQLQGLLEDRLTAALEAGGRGGT